MITGAQPEIRAARIEDEELKLSLKARFDLEWMCHHKADIAESVCDSSVADTIERQADALLAADFQGAPGFEEKTAFTDIDCLPARTDNDCIQC